MPKQFKKITMYSTDWCGGCFVARKFFDENKIPYEYIDIESDPKQAEVLRGLNNGYETVPTIIVEAETPTESFILREPNWLVLQNSFLTDEEKEAALLSIY